MIQHKFRKKHQSGATLAIGLILLLVMTLLGVTAMKSTSLQEKMAGGLRNKVLAEGGAESALREAENYLWNYFADSNGLALIADPNATFGVYTFESPTALLFRDGKDWVDAGLEHEYDFTTTSGNASLKKNPRYIIEEIVSSSGYAGLAEFGDDGYGASAGVLRTYRITARAVSGDGKTTEMAESVFSTRTK
jgi:type IV pilus assembly protein PilX